MSFNHYAKLKRILEDQKPGWYIGRIDKPTSALTFSGQRVSFSHYYRLYTHDGEVIKFGKFQQPDRLAKVLGVEVKDLPIKTVSTS